MLTNAVARTLGQAAAAFALLADALWPMAGEWRVIEPHRGSLRSAGNETGGVA